MTTLIAMVRCFFAGHAWAYQFTNRALGVRVYRCERCPRTTLRAAPGRLPRPPGDPVIRPALGRALVAVGLARSSGVRG